jgi:septal ring factor EnvC (AmiA/AmiB activator)
MKNQLLVLLAPVLLFISGCGTERADIDGDIGKLTQILTELSSENTQLRKDIAGKAEELGKLSQQVTELRIENAKLRKEAAKTDIHSVGKQFLLILGFLAVLLINNAVWYIIYRRQQ